jgi:transposase
VGVVLTIRRFACANAACARRTFIERFGDQLGQRARRTGAADALLLRLARAAGAEAGARLATAAGLAVSSDTLLRLGRRAAADGAPTPRVLGVHDSALRRGRVYATLLVDLEARRPVDVLDGRGAGPLVAWLQAHPGVEAVACDRAEAYDYGAARRAPTAVQVSDRFHLVRNAAAALDALLRGRRRLLDRAAAVTVAAEPTSTRSSPARPAVARDYAPATSSFGCSPASSGATGAGTSSWSGRRRCSAGTAAVGACSGAGGRAVRWAAPASALRSAT